MTSRIKQTRTKTRKPIDILKSITFYVNLIIAVVGAELAGAYYVSRKATNCKPLVQKAPSLCERSEDTGGLERRDASKGMI